MDPPTCPADSCALVRPFVRPEGCPANEPGPSEISSTDPACRTGPMLDAWRDRCPIYLALLRTDEVELTTRVARPA